MAKYTNKKESKANQLKAASNVTKSNGVALIDNRTQPLAQLKKNDTGLPDKLKSGIENLSGHSMDDVKVHYNSIKPAQLNAHAYAQGNQIHLAPGQEKHLPHEAWHVAQQKQGRVKPTKQLKEKVNINDDAGLEKEADVMGGKALQMRFKEGEDREFVLERGLTNKKSDNKPIIIQRHIINNDNERLNIGAFVQAALPLILSGLGSRATQIFQALREMPQHGLTIIHNRLLGYVNDGQERTVESVVKEAIGFLTSLVAGPTAVPSALHGVNAHSMGEDFTTHSSDSHGFIARNLGTHEFPLPHYVGNPSALSGSQALVPSPRGMSLHPSLRISSPQREIMWLLTGHGELIFGNRPVNLRRPHPTMIGGEDPQVYSGGTLTMRDNRISAIRDDSGHFQPGRSGVVPAIGAFHRLPSNIFHHEFTGFRAFGMQENTGFGRTQRAEMMLQGQELFRISNHIIAQMRGRVASDRGIPEVHLTASAIGRIGGRHIELLKGVKGVLLRIQDYIKEYVPYFSHELQPLVILVRQAIVITRLAIHRAELLMSAPTMPRINSLHPLYANIERFLRIFERAEVFLRRTSMTSTSSFGI